MQEHNRIRLGQIILAIIDTRIMRPIYLIGGNWRDFMVSVFGVMQIAVLRPTLKRRFRR
jgi:hypothetical protein